MLHLDRAAWVFATVFACVAFSVDAHAQLPMTQVEGNHIECPDVPLHPCLMRLENELIQQHSAIVQRDADDRLSARLKTGRWVSVSDGFALDILQHERYLALLVFGEEDISWRVLDLETGKTTNFEGYPLFSPDGRHIVSAEADDMNSNFLDIYDVKDKVLVRVFRAIKPQDKWWPAHVCWIDDQTVGYMRTAYKGSNTAGAKVIGTPETLVFKDGKWRIERSNARCAGTS